MKKSLAIFSCLLGLAAVAVAASSWCMVAPGEIAVVRRLGRLVEPSWGPGLHWCYPLGIDRIDRIRCDAVRQLTIGLAGPAASDLEPGTGEMLTGDLNLVRIEATVQYRAARPEQFVISAREVEPLLADAGEASVSRALAARGVDAVLRTDRQGIARDVEHDLQNVSDRYGLGVAILGMSLTAARPPDEVEADFAAAQSAESERDRRINEARSYEETTVTAARSSALAKLESARAASERTLLTARAKADRFLVLLAEAQHERPLTMRRLYIDAMQSMLDRVRRKLIMPAGDAVDLTVLGAQEAAASSGAVRATPRQIDAHAGAKEGLPR
jgi:modulator of FtsH protease HflK